MSIRLPFSIIILLPFFALLSCGGKDPVPDPILSTSDFRFSVSPSQKVLLAKGNVQYCPAQNQWRFASTQYLFLGDENALISSQFDGWIDLFGWGTGDSPVSADPNDAFYSSFSDHGVHFDGGWRTLSADEWDYILNRRPNASLLRAKGSVHREKGFILLPDGWQCPPSVFFTPSPDSNETEYTMSDWKKMEDAGAIFLPAAGRRSVSALFNVGDRAYYWTSSPVDSSQAFALYIVDHGANPFFPYPRHCGLALRLAKDS